MRVHPVSLPHTHKHTQNNTTTSIPYKTLTQRHTHTNRLNHSTITETRQTALSTTLSVGYITERISPTDSIEKCTKSIRNTAFTISHANSALCFSYCESSQSLLETRDQDQKQKQKQMTRAITIAKIAWRFDQAKCIRKWLGDYSQSNSNTLLWCKPSRQFHQRELKQNTRAITLAILTWSFTQAKCNRKWLGNMTPNPIHIQYTCTKQPRQSRQTHKQTHKFTCANSILVVFANHTFMQLTYTRDPSTTNPRGTPQITHTHSGCDTRDAVGDSPRYNATPQGGTATNTNTYRTKHFRASFVRTCSTFLLSRTIAAVCTHYLRWLSFGVNPT